MRPSDQGRGRARLDQLDQDALAVIIDSTPLPVLVWHCHTDDPGQAVLVAGNLEASWAVNADLDADVGRSLRDVFPSALDPIRPGLPSLGEALLMAIDDGSVSLTPVEYADGRIGRQAFAARFVHLGERRVAVFLDEIVKADARSRVTHELRDDNESLLVLNRRLAEANAELDRYARTVAHDLKGPLTTIVGYADLLGRVVELPESGQEVIARLRSNVERANSMIDDLLDFAIDPRVRGTRKQVELGEVAHQVVTEMGDRITEAGAFVDATGAGTALGNASALRQVLTNLVENALKYRSPDDVARVHIEVSRLGTDVLVSVSDRGVGIPTELRESVFDTGARLTPTIASGTGLGLATCRTVMLAHDGRIWIDDPEPGWSTTVRMSLPAADQPAASRASTSLTSGTSRKGSGQTTAAESTPTS